MLLDTSIWSSLLSILAIIVLIIIIVQHKYSYFTVVNLPGPKPSFLLGNFGTLWKASNYFRQLETWTKEYGKIYGIYEGTLPIYVVSDVDFLEEVFIKQFSNFETRKPVLFLLADHPKRMHLINATGSRWRRQRHVINPLFSKSKLVSMTPLIDECTTKVLSILQSYADKNIEIDVQPIYMRLMMDTICQCAFSLQTDVQQNPENIYFKKLATFFGVENRKLFFVKFSELIVQWNKRFPSFQLNELPYLWLLSRIGEHILLARQRTDYANRVDLLSLMLNAATDEEILDTNDLSKGTSAVGNKVTLDEIMGNMFLFVAAGTETTATTLSYCTVVLTMHPDIQERLRDEIDAHCEDLNVTDLYDAVEKLPYLDIFIKEVTRMYPAAAPGINRLCVKDTVVGKHYIRKGTVIQPDIYTIHYDPDLWGPVDPYVFYPERHLTKRLALANFAFGAGPRQCVGMRLSLLELKIAVVRLLQTFVLVKSEKMDKTALDVELTAIRPEQVLIKLQRRSLMTSTINLAEGS